MAKLLVSDKELIRNKFVQKAGKKLSDYLAKIGTQLQDRVNAILPPEIESIVDRYPSMQPLLFYRSISINDLLKIKGVCIYETIPFDGIGMPKMFYNEYMDDLKRYFEKIFWNGARKRMSLKSWKTKPETELLVLSTISTQKSNYKTTSRKPIRF